MISAYTYGSLFQLTCGTWALIICIPYAFVLKRLLGELKRQRLEPAQSSKAAAQVSPEWNQLADGAAMEPPAPKRFAALMDDDENAKLFYPPFSPASSVSTDPTDVLFVKVFRNIVSIGAVALFTFLFLICVSHALEISEASKELALITFLHRLVSSGLLLLPGRCRAATARSSEWCI